MDFSLDGALSFDFDITGFEVPQIDQKIKAGGEGETASPETVKDPEFTQHRPEKAGRF